MTTHPSPNQAPNIHNTPETPVISESELIQIRKEKLNLIRQNKKTAFPNDFIKTHDAQEIFKLFNHETKESLENLNLENKKLFKIAGRIMLKRMMGKASFITLMDSSGKIQAYLKQAELPENIYEEFKHWDIGDIIGLEGYAFKTNTGELSLHATQIQLLTKSLRPLPDKFHGLSDTETKYRQRYVDLIMNEESRKVFKIRSQIIQSLREYLMGENYLEVETPMMQVIPGGASAKPFKTFHNSLNLEMYLRIAPELYLKRLVVGGFERVFEINRNFRNEGLSTRHNPEFTMCEFYQAYADYKTMMDHTEALFKKLALELNGHFNLTYQGIDFDLSKPFTRMSVLESILFFNKELKLEDLNNFNHAVQIAKKLGIQLKGSEGLGKVQIEIFEKTVEHQLLQPTFITEYPAEVSPLARRNDKNPFITDRFEFFMGGREIANGFSELNDAEDQAERFQEQVKAHEAGDEEAMFYDADYVRALEYGLPPTAGEGIGIDRLVMLFTNAPSIRDVILFPHMKPE